MRVFFQSAGHDSRDSLSQMDHGGLMSYPSDGDGARAPGREGFLHFTAEEKRRD